MDDSQLREHQQNQAKIYALQCVVSALVQRHLLTQGDMKNEAEHIGTICASSIQKFDLTSAAPEGQVETARTLMDSFANETIVSASVSARKWREKGQHEPM